MQAPIHAHTAMEVTVEAYSNVHAWPKANASSSPKTELETIRSTKQ